MPTGSTLSRVLMIGESYLELNGMGVAHCPDINEADQYLLNTPPAILILTPQVSNKNKFIDFSENVTALHPHCLKLVVLNDSVIPAAEEFINTGQVIRVLNPNQNKELPFLVRQTYESFTQKQQDQDLITLLREQNRKLESLSKTLEQRIRKREKYLLRSQKRLSTMNLKVESLHAALIAVHKANSIGEMESLLSESLREILSLSWIRILFRTQEHLKDQITASQIFDVYGIELILDGIQAGSINFARDIKNPFSDSEREFLNQISEAITLAIDRIMKLEEAEHLKQQWESTFDSIHEPIALTDRHFSILRTNRAFAEVSRIPIRSLHGKDVFESMFSKSHTPLTHIRSSNSFQFLHKKKTKDTIVTFDVTGQALDDDSIYLFTAESPIYLIFFRNISRKLQLERQILESAKMAELGTIGSSIAHELNNPLGGIISFIQLILMDLKKDSPHFEDINEMRKAGQRCKEIVENLLGFSRPHDSEEYEPVDLNEVVQQSLKIIELRTRSKGVELSVKLPAQETKVLGNFSLLSQMVRNLLQNAYEAIEGKLATDRGFKGQIKVEIRQSNQLVNIFVSDNADSLINLELSSLESQRTSTSLGLTVAYKIVAEHNGELEIFSQPKIESTAKVSLRRLDLNDHRQVFDG